MNIYIVKSHASGECLNILDLQCLGLKLMGYKFGLVSVSFRQHSPEVILDTMNKSGLSVIEWGSDIHVPPEKANEIAVLQKKYGIKCCSYGTYFRIGVTPIGELEKYLSAAKILGTDIVRVWCGDKNSEEYTVDERKKLFEECKKANEIAKRYDVILCMECHNFTYTNMKESALELMKAVDSAYFRMYWQPNQYKSELENIEYARLVSDYTTHLHVFNWNGDIRLTLSDAIDEWRRYLSCFDSERNLLLEFVPDDNIETLSREAQALKEITKVFENESN